MAKYTPPAKESPENLSEYEFLSVDPTTIVVDPSIRGRVRKEPTQEEIDTLAKSIDDEGQLQPVQCFRNSDDQLVLNLGFTRHAAIMKLHAENLKIRIDVLIPKKTPKIEDLFRQNLAENIQRKNTSLVDDAFNQEELRSRYNWSDVKISRFFDQDTATVSRLKKILTLDEGLQEEVKAGHLGLMGLEVLYGIPDEHRMTVFSKARMELNPKKDDFLVGTSLLRKTWNDLKASLEQAPSDGQSEGQGSGESEGDGEGERPLPSPHEPTIADKMSRPSIIDHFKAEANKGQRVKSEGGGNFNKNREDLHRVYLDFFEGRSLWDRVDVVLCEIFPHSDEDLAMIPDPPQEEVKPKSKRGRPKKVKEETQEVGSYNFGGMITPQGFEREQYEVP